MITIEWNKIKNMQVYWSISVFEIISFWLGIPRSCHHQKHPTLELIFPFCLQCVFDPLWCLYLFLFNFVHLRPPADWNWWVWRFLCVWVDSAWPTFPFLREWAFSFQVKFSTLSFTFTGLWFFHYLLFPLESFGITITWFLPKVGWWCIN